MFIIYFKTHINNEDKIIIIIITKIVIIIIIIIIIIILTAFPKTRKYWVDVQRGIVSSHGERDPL